MLLLLMTCIIAQEPQLMDKERLTAYRKLLPQVDSPVLQKILTDPSTILWTDKELPKAHQEWEGLLQGMHDSRENVSADRSEPHGNGNKEFPWAHPAGTHEAKNVGSFRFLNLPKQVNGKPWPVVYFQGETYRYGNRTLPDGSRMGMDESHHRPGWHWLFPIGSVVGEVLFLRDKEGYGHTFELRTRTRHADGWRVNVFRPYPTAKDLLEALQGMPGAEALIKHLKAPLATAPTTVQDNQPDRRVFAQTRRSDIIPALPDPLVDKLLDRPFRSALDKSWRDEDGSPHAPTTDATYHIVPKGYLGSHLTVSSKACMDCHQGTNLPVSEFNVRRDWYGRIRGSDGIFSFHPFDPEAVIGARGVRVKFNRELKRAGVIAPFDAKDHPKDRYQRIPGLQ